MVDVLECKTCLLSKEDVVFGSTLYCLVLNPYMLSIGSNYLENDFFTLDSEMLKSLLFFFEITEGEL
jgi:hypothetical protein